MKTSELYLKTIFCCIACDGEIAGEEIKLVKDFAAKNEEFKDVDVEAMLNKWVSEINADGAGFLKAYLNELAGAQLADDEQMAVIDLALKAIEEDRHIEYSEVKFFKKIRSKLSLSDEAILSKHPDKEDFLLPDISVAEDPIWEESTKFGKIDLKTAI